MEFHSFRRTRNHALHGNSRDGVTERDLTQAQSRLNAEDGSSGFERGGNLVELVEPVMMPQPERLALYFEIPAVA